jgi:short-subunit dehydrogenase
MPASRRASTANTARIATRMADDGPALVITGASAGIGSAVALAAARAGYRLVIVARRAARLEELAAAIRDAGGLCAVLTGDVTSREMPARIVDMAVRTYGRIDVLLNNAGAGAYGTLLAQSDAAIEAQWQLNVAAPLRIARAAVAQLEATRGQLIFVGSGVARIPLPQQGAYALTKAAIRAAAIQLRRELRPRGIAVTYVDPGVAATEFHSASGIGRPPGPIVSPERVARAILRGMQRRAAVVNAVPWQTAFTVAGELSGTLADPIVNRFFTVRRERVATPRDVPNDVTASGPSQAAHSERSREVSDAFETALGPVARRMERVKLPQDFLRQALVPGATLELGALAMRWAGMPNKNERAVLREALDALAANGYLKRTEEESWIVLRAAE